MSAPEAQSEPQKTAHPDAALVVGKLKDICMDDGVQSSILWIDGQIAWCGPESETVYNAWSATKSFTSSCVGLMVDAGKLSLDLPAHEWLPELKPHYPDVTLRHLLTFTSGLQTEPSNPFELLPPRFACGEHMHYSPESEWISLAVSRVCGQPMSDLFMEKIGSVIGIDTDTFRWGKGKAPDGTVVSGGSGALERGVFTNARNLLRFGQWALKRGQWDGRQLVSREWMEEAQSSQPITRVPPWSTVEGEGWYRDWLPGTYGLHWWVNGIRRSGEQLWPAAPASTFAAQGNLNQICLVIPEWNCIIVRMGKDGIIDMRRYNEVLHQLKEIL